MVTYENFESEEDKAAKSQIKLIKENVSPMTRQIEEYNIQEQSAVDVEFD